MKRRWTDEELAEYWTLHAEELSIATNPNTSSNQLGFALMLKWFQHEGQFPKRKQDIPSAVIDFLAPQLHIDPGVFKSYPLQGRTGERHRSQIRQDTVGEIEISINGDIKVICDAHSFLSH